MRIILTTGFEKVTHSIEFHPQAEPKGQDLVESGHVKEVKEFRDDGRSTLIESRIVRQAAVYSPVYFTKLYVHPKIHYLNKIQLIFCHRIKPNR